MGSVIRTNDTLQITCEQGFPAELDLEKHKVEALKAEDFASKIFSFQDKPGLRVYHAPPVRNFLVENIDGKWLYWGLIHILETTFDMVNQTTSGKYKIIYINSPEEMDQAHHLIDQNPETYIKSLD